MDVSLLITIGLIFLLTMAAGFVRSWKTDRCLRSFHRFNVELHKTDGKRVWGRMDLSAGGIEFSFPERRDSEQRLKTSYLLYAGEFKLIQAILRYADRLTEVEQRVRAADVARSFHPGLVRRLLRRGRNFLGSATDSLRDVLAMIVGRVQKMQDPYVVAEGADALTKIGGTVLTEVSSIHDPLLERHIGLQVVAEVIEGDEIHEHVGIFKEYSAGFIHLLDVQYPHAWSMDVPMEGVLESGHVTVGREGDALRIANRGERPVLVVAIEIADAQRPIDALIDAGGTVMLADGAGHERIRLRLQTVRDIDMIVPRSRSAVRHRAEPASALAEPESMWDMVFDLGTRIRGEADDDAREERLRRELEKDPAAVAAAAGLGGLLLKKQDFGEAGRWLRVAYNGRDTLPDGGRRVRMQLRELARRLAQRGAESEP